MATIDNGVNVQALLDARAALAETPAAAQFTWRASSRWTTESTARSPYRTLRPGGRASHKIENEFDSTARRSRRRGRRHNADRVPPRGPGGVPQVQASASIARSRGSSCARSSRPSRPATISANPRRRQRRPQRLQRHQGRVTIERTRPEEIEALVAQSQSAPRCSTTLQPDPSPSPSPERPRRRALKVRAIERFTAVVIAPARRAGHQQLFDRRSIDTSCSAGRGRKLLAARRWDSLRCSLPTGSLTCRRSVRRPGSRRYVRSQEVVEIVKRFTAPALGCVQPGRTSPRCD